MTGISPLMPDNTPSPGTCRNIPQAAGIQAFELPLVAALTAGELVSKVGGQAECKRVS